MSDEHKTTVSLEEQAKECEREVQMRKRVYGRWVDSGKMTQSAADLAIARMEAAAATLRKLAALYADLPYLMGRASAEGHDAGQRLAREWREKLDPANKANGDLFGG